YNAAITRLEYLLKKYPHTVGFDKALYFIAMSYKALGDPVKSNEYIEKLQKEYPHSKLNKSSNSRGVRQTLKSSKKEFPPIDQSSTKRREIDLRPQIIKASTKGETVRVTPDKQQAGQTDKDKSGLGFIDRNKPIDIVSDTMEGFDKEKMVVFKGSVVARQDDLYIFSDVVETFLNEESNEISKAYAKGSVKIVKQDRTATAQEAFFDNIKREIILKGDVVVFQGQDKITGNVITYYINEDKVVVEGDPEKRARAILTPKPKNQ
ncbi:MAG: lipopolysaccharide transport periplasmic protein LptA, partial [Syntrophorhabdus sp.]